MTAAARRPADPRAGTGGSGLGAFAEASFRRGEGRFTARELALACGVVAWWAGVYEIVEWRVAILVDPQAGAAFLGTQGDPWDAQKDLALGLLGGALGGAGEWILTRTLQGWERTAASAQRAPRRSPIS